MSADVRTVEVTSPARPSQDMSVSSRIAGPLWAVFGLVVVISSVSAADHRWWLVGIGAGVTVMGLVFSMIDWTRVPESLTRTLPIVAGAFVAVIGLLSPDQELIVALATFAICMWTGIALNRIDIAAALVMAPAYLAVTGYHASGTSGALHVVALIWPIAVVVGVGMSWLRGKLDQATRLAARAKLETTEAHLAAREASETAERARAEDAAVQLHSREALQADLGRRATELTTAARAVSGETTSTAASVHQLSGAISELAVTAQATDRISAGVAEMAKGASELMERLSETSQGVLAASSVISGIASRTNLLALNATIESARAGSAGVGFAVVAGEVKELARQSGENAETIDRILGQVLAEIADAVAHVEEIRSGMGELHEQHASLAAAIEEQSVVVATISGSVSDAADQAQRIADGVAGLEAVARG